MQKFELTRAQNNDARLSMGISEVGILAYKSSEDHLPL